MKSPATKTALVLVFTLAMSRGNALAQKLQPPKRTPGAYRAPTIAVQPNMLVDQVGEALQISAAGNDAVLTMTSRGYRLEEVQKSGLRLVDTSAVPGRILAAAMRNGTAVVASEISDTKIGITVLVPAKAPTRREVDVPYDFPNGMAHVALDGKSFAVNIGAVSGTTVFGLTIFGLLDGSITGLVRRTPPGPIAIFQEKLFYGGSGIALTSDPADLESLNDLTVVPKMADLATGALSSLTVLSFRGNPASAVQFDVVKDAGKDALRFSKFQDGVTTTDVANDATLSFKRSVADPGVSLTSSMVKFAIRTTQKCGPKDKNGKAVCVASPAVAWL